MNNGFVRLGQFLSFFAGVLIGTADLDGKWYAAAALIAVAIILDVIAINYIDKGVKEETEKAR